MEGIIKTTANLPSVTIQSPLASEENADTQESDTEALAKQVCKLSQKVADLLGEKGAWSINNNKSTLAPGVQQPRNDWTANAVDCEDKYVFTAEVGNAEALEPQNLAEAKKRSD